MEDDSPGNPLMALLEKHSGAINSLTIDVRDMSLDVLVLRAMIWGLMDHAKETGIDVRASCMAVRDNISKEHRASFVARLKTMYGIDLPV